MKMARLITPLLIASLTLGACGDSGDSSKNRTPIRVVSQEQQQLHKLDAYNLAIGLKRAIYDAGYTCKQVTDAGFVGTWENLDQWAAHCEYENGTTRDWVIFAGPDGSAQVRDCKDVAASGLPACIIKKRPAGSFILEKK
jgi:hypothetical protein